MGSRDNYKSCILIDLIILTINISLSADKWCSGWLQQHSGKWSGNQQLPVPKLAISKIQQMPWRSGGWSHISETKTKCLSFMFALLLTSWCHSDTPSVVSELFNSAVQFTGILWQKSCILICLDFLGREFFMEHCAVNWESSVQLRILSSRTVILLCALKEGCYLKCTNAN